MVFEPRGGGLEDVGAFFQGGDTGGVVVRVGDVSTNPQDGSGPESFQTQGRAMAHREASGYTGGWELGVPTIGGSNGGSSLLGDQDIHHEEAEHVCAVYCNATDSGPLLAFLSEAEGKGVLIP